MNHLCTAGFCHLDGTVRASPIHNDSLYIEAIPGACQTGGNRFLLIKGGNDDGNPLDLRLRRRRTNNVLPYKEVFRPVDVIEGIEKVSADGVSNLAHQIFRPDSLSLTVLGPVTEKDIPRNLFSA